MKTKFATSLLATILTACFGISLNASSLKLAEPLDMNQKNEWKFETFSEIKAQPINYVYYPPGYHSLLSRAINAESFKTEDDSTWYVAPSSQATVAWWVTGDPIVLYPRGWTWCWDNYKFYFFNTRTQTSAEVYLFDGPLNRGYYTKEIVSIDLTYGTIRLTDDTYWEVENAFVLTTSHKEWYGGQAIIVGLNNSKYSVFDRILLNVERGIYVPARQYQP